MYNIFYQLIYVLTVVTLYTPQLYTLWDPICSHIERTWSMWVGLKMAAMRPKHVVTNL